MQPHRTAPRSRNVTAALSAIVVSLLAASTAYAGQASAQMHVGLTITGHGASAPVSAQAAAPNNKIKNTTVKREGVTTVVVSYY